MATVGVLRIKASSGGTVEEGTSIGTANVTWRTNATAVPRTHALTLYDLPGASSTAWTKADLDAAQIGVRATAADTLALYVSAMWVAVEFVPGANPPVAQNKFVRQAVNRSATY
jgi:hypothetical protein